VSFPETRRTFIQRRATLGDEGDWRRFMDEYWSPVCRFATRSGRLKPDETEDVASVAFAGIIQSNLLMRWIDNPSAKLRTLLCTVVRNVLSNQARIDSGRSSLLERDRHLLPEVASIHFDETASIAPEELSEFYSVWVDELLQEVIDRLLDDYLKSARGDYFRVLYGRICEQMTSSVIADHLGVKFAISLRIGYCNFVTLGG